ncbi:MAG: bifunctional DNA-formamidopyrimidine glycosylase/DNA-(apurinic or apyrimidinic site) lyase [Deltaproteobacteria bacterium]|nr:bifunctional DNA-formamidopyrimidine glycosylase/DNA-(apurinic or apyrimidinic site) lyase [Deltaproteobacteria bacterium]
MPELPEVEVASRQLRAWAQGRRIEGVDVPKTRVVRAQPVSAFAQLVGKRMLSIERRGKWMLLAFEGGLGLLSHLGMTGKWMRRAKSDPLAKHTRATLLLEGGSALDYRDPRLFGVLEVGPFEALTSQRALATLGPDPLQGIDAARLSERFARTIRSLKETLMDQTLLAGLGNIQVAESLFRAKLSPERPARSLTRDEVVRLARAIEASLRATLMAEDGPDPIAYVEEGGANLFQVYGHAGEPCPACKTPIERIVQGGRSSFFCPHCQPLPKGMKSRVKPVRAAKSVKVAKPSRIAKPAKKAVTPARKASRPKKVQKRR